MWQLQVHVAPPTWLKHNFKTSSLCLQGCYDLVTSFMETNMGIIAGVAFGIAFSQVAHIVVQGPA